MVKFPGLTGRGPWKLSGLSVAGEDGIPGVAVKCVDIGRNTNGESSLSGPILTLRSES